MKTAVQEILEMINNRSDNSVRTKFNKEEIKYWLEKEKMQIIDAFIEGDKSIFLDSIENSADNYYDSKFKP